MYRLAFNHGLWNPIRDHLLHAFRCISGSDQNSAIRYSYQRDVKAYMIARLLILYVLRRHFLLDPVDVSIERTAEGRPHLPSQPGFDFNVSHNGDYTVLAACTHGRVGVDVMRVELPPFGTSALKFLLKMKNIFAASEWNFLMSGVSDTDKMQRFFRLWCLKEAYVKALGVGLSMDLQTVEFQVSNATPICICADPARWTFEEHILGPNHTLAIAWNISGPQVCSSVFHSVVVHCVKIIALLTKKCYLYVGLYKQTRSTR
ncbi:unnamed protein product [Schistocephalus solidus]|uniref:L-aminoadipate-semialdehyde dehydrogenase-phosphopantetheinyl transferase n=1 Tax=Schistocephalus solidus TaxID=70667 RepID=A0A183S7J2_SCHSO|nr:unnamed protein product [Schistocephalus solidus]